MDEDERQRKLEAARAKKPTNMQRNHTLASYRQRRAKGNGAGAAKKTQKGKGPDDAADERSAQDPALDASVPTGKDTRQDTRAKHEGPQRSGQKYQCQPPEPHQNHGSSAQDQSLSLGETLSTDQPTVVEDLVQVDLAALTGKEQLKQLQEAVEKRNEIISRLSSNLQEALASRDQVQQEAQTLAGQIQALQVQLQQTSQYLLRSKTQAGSELPHAQQLPPEPGLGSQDLAPVLNHLEEPGSAALGQPLKGFRSRGVESDSNADTETEALLHRLRTELEEEKGNSQRALHLLEEEKRGREEERREREVQLEALRTQLDRAQDQVREIQRFKEEKEALNREVQELRRRLQEGGEETGRAADRALLLETEKEEGMREEHREEAQGVQRLLEERERGMEDAAKEELGQKACKDEQNQARASVGEEGEDSLNGSGEADPLMERYLSSALPKRSPYSWTEDSLEEHSLLENSGNYRFELDSDVLEDQSQLSLSRHSLREEQTLDLHSYSLPRSSAVAAGDDQGAGDGSPLGWLRSSAGELSQGEFSEGPDLAKELLIQQCEELRREQEVLTEEVQKSAEDLEEARERWAQVTEELREALWELEEEKEKGRRCQDEMEEEREKRRRAEEEVNAKSHEEDNLKNKLSALLEERESEDSLLPLSPPGKDREGLQGELKELKEVQEEKAVLVSRLKQQERLVSSLQEMKLAGDSVTSEVQVLFGKQLQALQAHRDQVCAELEETKSRLKTSSALLGQKTMELDQALAEAEEVRREAARLREEAGESAGRLEGAERARAELESQLLGLEQNLTGLEEAQSHGAQEKEEQRRRQEERDAQIRRMEELIEEELEEFQKQLDAKDEEVAEEREKWEEERQEKEQELRTARRLLEEQREEREVEVRALLDRQLLAAEEAAAAMRRSHQEEVRELREEHHKEVRELNARVGAELREQRAALEEEQRRQICLIKQVNEREHQRMMSELGSRQREELSRLKAELSVDHRESMEAAHQAEIQQTQSHQSLEVEALRLSLTNLHTAQLELSQTNLHREREAALSELQASLREKWAQESAVLQARQQFELDRLREQSLDKEERQREVYQRSLDELEQKCESVSKEKASIEEQHATEMKALRLQWREAEKHQADLQTRLSEVQQTLADTQASLTQTRADLSSSRALVEELQASTAKEIQRLEEELSQAQSDRDTAGRSLEELVSSYKKVLLDKEEHIQQLEERESALQKEAARLLEEQVSLKQSSEQEVAQLWAQLDSMRTSRQELGELKEQLLARSSRVDDIERLKVEFNEQRREIRQQNEAELESLRRYFEQRLRAAEESYREEIALLQLRLVEGALEESVLKTGDASFMSEGKGEEERNEMLAEITLKLEKHKEELDALRGQLEERHTQEMSHLRSSMALANREDMLQVRTDLTDRYYSDLQELRTRHALELEQLRAKISDSHVRELTRIRLEAARQVEVEVEQRMWRHSEELQTRLTLIQTLETRLSSLTQHHAAELQRNAQQLKQEFAEELTVRLEEAQSQERERGTEEQAEMSREEEQVSSLRREEERRSLERELEEARERLQSLQDSLDQDSNPLVVAVRQKLDTQYDSELRRAKSCMAAEVKELTALLQEQGEDRLQQAQERFQEERGQLEKRLAQQNELSLGELRDKHQADLELQRTKLLAARTQETDTLRANHKAELDSLSASHKEQIAVMATELASKHKAELVALETRLESQRNAELDRLEAVLEEANQAQLEAQEAELNHRHQEERDELERRMLGNMDTLEATYLKEIQTLREHIEQLEDKCRQEVEQGKAALRQEVARERAEHLSSREELRRELAQVHMEKFSAMATELSHAHQTELATQREALETAHRLALEALRNQVLELEQQHSAALQDLAQTFNTEKQKLDTQHQLKLQEVRSVSTRELEACRKEIEEESSRQRLHFLEEAELSRVQSERCLQDRISQLKAEFEEQKEAELDEQRRGFSSEYEQKECSYTEKMSQLSAQLQQLDTVVSQLRSEVGCLQGELEGKRGEMETLDTLLQRRDREAQEGGNLLDMLTEDLKNTKQERHDLLLANEKLRNVLLEVVRSTMATEELIGRRVGACVGVGDPLQGVESGHQTTNQRASGGSRDVQQMGSVSVSEVSVDDLELSQRVCESLLLADTHLRPEGEEAVLGACGRLRHTIDTLLELLNQANTQLLQTHGVHLSLKERFSQGREDSAQLLQQHTHLLDQLNQEAGQKSQLQLDLHKAEGLLEGYVAEKAVLEEALQQKEAQEERLAEELEGLRVQLHQTEGLSVELESLRVQLHRAEGLGVELESLRVQLQELEEENALLLRQRDHLSAGLGERERGLLAEAQRLAQERLDVQRQAEKDHGCLSLRLRALEAELEEQETKGLETELHHRAQSEDLNQRVQALEKQLKHNRQFIDEQAVEREHERDEFQQEIGRLESQLRHTARGHSAGDDKGQRIEDLVLQVESLQALVRDKTEDHASLLAVNQQAQRDVVERNEEIDKLAGRIRELEQALLSSAESNRALSQLEQELHRAKQRELELTQDKQALEQQQLSNRLQISALQSKLDETRHRYHDNQPDPTQQLRDMLDTTQQDLQDRERQVENLIGQVEQVQRDLTIKEAELKHLTLQLEVLTNQNADHVSQLQDQIAALKENVSSLALRQEEREEERERGEEEGEEESLPSALLQEKNQEIDHLNQELQRLEQEVENSRTHMTTEADLEDLHSQVEHLHCDLIRLRQDKQEEEERLHEVISTLQAELNASGPTLHEVSDSQDGDSVNPSPSPSPSPEPPHPLLRGAPRRGEGHSLKQELRLLHASSSRSLRSRAEALQGQVEALAGEKEAMERLLHTQEEEYRGHGAEMGKRLREERERAEEVARLLSLKEAELEEEKSRRGEEEVVSVLQRERAQLNSLVLELQRAEEEKEKEVASLKERDGEREREAESLRESARTLERQVQEARAEVVAMETGKAELLAERETLRRREGQLREERERFRQGVTSLQARVQELSLQLEERGANQEESQKEVLTHAEATLAKADTALRQREAELARLGAEHQALRAELAAVKEGLSCSTERAEKLKEEGQTKDRALADLETYNQRLKVELRGLQEDLAVQEEELAYQQRELLQLRQQATPPHGQSYSQKDLSRPGFEEVVCGSRDEASLSSPEVLRRLECSEDKIRGGFHTSLLQGSHLSELSALNCTGLEPHPNKASTRGRPDPSRSRTITPEPTTRSTRSPGSVSASDNFSMLDSLDADKVHELENLDLTAPSSPLGSTSSLSAPEWASDGYGSNVSSELGLRLRVELEQTERLDAQFIEYLRCRGMNPAANTDSAAGSMSYSDELLSPELQGLLKRVYQESCRVLALSQRPAASSSQPRLSDTKTLLDQTFCPSEGKGLPLDQASVPPLGWQQEKRALQETVIALRELLCRMAQRDPQPDGRGDGAWPGGQVETQLREELEHSREQLNSAHNTLQELHNQIHQLRLAVGECEEALRKEQSRVQDVQLELEQERAHTLRRGTEEEERRQALCVSLEQQGSEVVSVRSQLEQEKVTVSNLRRELQIEHSRGLLLQSQLDKRLADAHKDLEEERQRSTRQLEAQSQDRARQENLVREMESSLVDTRSQIADAHRKLDEERERCCRQLEEIARRQEADATRDRKFISDMRSQLEQERRQGEELAAMTDRLRAELLQCRRKGEEEDRRRREESLREQEATARLRVATAALKEQKQEAGGALEAERERAACQGAELRELKERLQQMREKEREREEQRERERRKERQEQAERERRHQRTSDKLSELALLRLQDQQRMRELQQTLAELEREEREMASQRLAAGSRATLPAGAPRPHGGALAGPAQAGPAQAGPALAGPALAGPAQAGPVQAGTPLLNHQSSSSSSSALVEKLLKENSELSGRVAELSGEGVDLKQTLRGLERQLRRSESELAKVTAETRNRPAVAADINNSKVQRLYERYLRAESFRKSLVYQKRYLLLLLGGFQDCEQATLCLIARMGVHPSPPLSGQRRPLTRFRAAVRAVVAISRLRFLTRKWQKAIRRSVTTSSTVNGHAQGSRTEVLRQQHPGAIHNSSPPTRDGSPTHMGVVSTLVPPMKSPFRLHNRGYSNSTVVSERSVGTSQDAERSLTEYINHLEKVQQRLGGGHPDSATLHSNPKKSDH
ncbi:pericentrin isoform X2 [Osmerus eperlanus]|uniref:pericentrin isoform X2 n=1 Tax=Osmerus eperlanus TaxID=29151 RepID=UPI002E0DC22E